MSKHLLFLSVLMAMAMSMLSLSGHAQETPTQPATLDEVIELSEGCTFSKGAGNEYPWVLTTTDAADGDYMLGLMSSNYHESITDSRDTLFFSSESSFALSFDWAVSSEPCCDSMSISLDGTVIVNQVLGYNPATTGHFEEILLPGSHVLSMNYHKDGSVNSGYDRGFIYNIKAETTSSLSPHNITISCEEGITLTANKTQAYLGDTVLLSIHADEGAVVVLTSNLNIPLDTATTFFIMPNKDVTISAINGSLNNIFELDGVSASQARSTDYPWAATTADAAGDYMPGLMSSNYHENNTESRDTLFFESDDVFSLSFDWAVSSEEDYDMLFIWVDGLRVVQDASGDDPDYDNCEGSFSEMMTAGLHTIVMRYTKDEGSDDGLDRGFIYNVSAVAVPDFVPTPHDITITCGNGVTLTANKEQASLGDTVRISVQLAEGYSRLYTASNLGYPLTDYFIMPNKDVTISASAINVSELFTLEGVTVSFGEPTDYQWIVTTEDIAGGYMPGLMSTNYNLADTESRDTLFIASDYDFTLSFDWATSSERNCDEFSIWLDDELIVDVASGYNTDNDNCEGTYQEKLDGGKHTLVVSYEKDESENEGLDRAFIYNISAVADTSGAPTALDAADSDALRIEKTVRDGHIYIRVNGRTYDATGRRM